MQQLNYANEYHVYGEHWYNDSISDIDGMEFIVITQH